MDSFIRLTESIWGYVSPAKILQARQAVKPQNHSHARTRSRQTNRPRQNRPAVERAEMTPMSKTLAWLSGTSSDATSPNGDHNIRKVQTGRVTKTTLARRPKQQLPHKDDDDDEQEDRVGDISRDGVSWEGPADDTLVDGVSASEDALIKTAHDDSISLDGSTFINEGDTILQSVEEEDSQSPALQSSHRKRHHKPETQIDPDIAYQLHVNEEFEDTISSASDWTRAERSLYNHIMRRNKEPVFPGTWKSDFPTYPLILFSKLLPPHDEQTVIFRSLSNRQSLAKRSWDDLVRGIGSNARSRLTQGLCPETMIKKMIRDYMKWAARDGEYDTKTYPPFIAIAIPPNSPPLRSYIQVPRCTLPGVVLESRLRAKLEKLTERHVAFDPTNPPPTLFGVLIIRATVVLVTYSPARAAAKALASSDETLPEDPMRMLGLYNFTKKTQDVWHALAVALLVLEARDELLRVRQRRVAGEEGDFPDDEEAVARKTADPDA